MRSLTCKSHAAASKRAIIGRSADFDVLLARFIAKNPSKAVSSESQTSQFLFTKTFSGKQVNVEDKCMQSEKKPRIIESNHKKMTLPLILNKCSPFLSTKYQPFTDNLRYSWFSRNIKSWLSEPLKLYAQSRKAIDQSNNRS